MVYRRLLIALVAWTLFGTALPVSVATSGIAVSECSPQPVLALLQPASGEIPSPFVGSSEAAQEAAAQAGPITRSARERVEERTRRRTSVVVTVQRVRIAKLTYMGYSRALAEANAGLPSWHSTAPPPLS